jgi:CheY-like chemotaxis protein
MKRYNKNTCQPVRERLFPTSALARPNSTALLWPLLTVHQPPRKFAAAESAPRTPEAPLIYAVDDLPGLTDLYRIVLEESGYAVRTFNNRIEALASLRMERKRPDLLIMDYLGHSITADRFIQRCRVVHPGLRILLASGVDQTTAYFSRSQPDRFFQKPFTIDELQREVRTVLSLA